MQPSAAGPQCASGPNKFGGLRPYVSLWLKSWLQCTMRYAMEIDILEVCKSKNSLHAHFILKSIHSFFRWCKTTKNLLGIKILSFYAYLKGLSWKNWRGGLTRLKFWSPAIKIICNKKVQNSDFVSAALHGENGSKSEKWDFLLFFL